MDKFTQWLTDKFQHPLSLLLFILGTLLVLLGITKGFKVPYLEQLVSEGPYKWASLVLGVVLLLLSVYIYYHPVKEEKEITADEQIQSPAERTQMPAELQQSFGIRLASITSSQEEILRHIARTSFRAGGDRSMVSGDSIRNHFKGRYEDRELFYRLENLYLLGFLEKVATDEDKYNYRLTTKCDDEIGTILVRAAMSTSKKNEQGEHDIPN